MAHNEVVMEERHREQTITDYLVVVRRYKWLILATALLVPVAAYFLSAQQTKVYRATSDVLLNRQDLGSTLTGIPTQSTVTDPVRYARTQAQLASVPAVTQAAVESAGIEGMDAAELADSSNVGANEETDILTFGVNHGDPDVAARLATAYAEAFVGYRLETETASLQAARREIQGRLAELRAAGASDTETYRLLAQQAQSIRTLELLQAPASVVRPADGAGQIAPTPRRNAILGVLLGLMLGLGAAFGLNAIDRRVREADELERELGIPLLAKLPTPRGRGGVHTILNQPSDEMAEAVGQLRTSFDFANVDLRAKVVMVTSAGPREGKSTTTTNLAIALARTGRHVVLVDLDLRRPSLTRILHLPDGPGLTDIANRNVALTDALQPVGVTPLRARLASVPPSDSGAGRLEVVTAGRTRVEPGEFVETNGFAYALQELRSYAEIVLVDTAPILATSEAMALTAKVDAILLISRLGTVTRPTLRELVRVLGRSPAPVLGVVATGAELDENYSYYPVEDYAKWSPHVQQEPASMDVPEVRSASGGSTRWTPRRGG
jgi:capsular exopolysaccharide synthesis family protein